METVRINTYMKETVVRRLMNHAFEERKKALQAEWYALGDAVYKDLYPEEVLTKMKAMPAEFLPMDDDVRVSFGGDFTRVYFGENRLLSYGHLSNAARVYDSKHPLSVRHDAYHKAKDQLTEEERKAESSAKAILDSVTTLKKLIETWPEVEPFVEDFKQTATGRYLPALPVQDLNARLGLPKKEAK